MNKVVIAGGSGFLGRVIVQEFAASGNEVVVLSRSPQPVQGARVRVWDARTVGEWAQELEGARCVANVSGSSVMVRWSEANKNRILESRVLSGRALSEAIRRCRVPPQCFVSASGIGYYGDTGDRIVDETGPRASGFLADVCQRWEEPVLAFHGPDTRGLVLRIGFVLGSEGGLRLLANLARMFLGGPMGNGRQGMSWIHVKDVARMLRWAVERGSGGVYNAVSPEPTTNAEFMAALRRVLRRPWAPPIPEFGLRFAARLCGLPLHLGLESCRAVPGRAIEEGFEFEFPNLEDALRDALGLASAGVP